MSIFVSNRTLFAGRFYIGMSRHWEVRLYTEPDGWWEMSLGFVYVGAFPK